MTFRVELRIDGNASGAKAALDEASKATERLRLQTAETGRTLAANTQTLGRQAQELQGARAAAVQAAAAQETLAAAIGEAGRQTSVATGAAGLWGAALARQALGLQASEVAAQKAAASHMALGAAVGSSGRQMAAAAAGTVEPLRLSGQQIAGMQFQLNDLAVQLASGSSPFLAITQQGAQIVQMFGPGTGVQGALRAVGTGLVTFVTNPLNVMVIGLASAAAAVPALWQAFAGGDEVERQVLGIDDAIQRLAGSAGDATPVLQEFARALRDQQEAARDQESAALLVEKAWEGVTSQLPDLRAGLVGTISDLDLMGQSGSAVSELHAAFERFASGVESGKGSVADYRAVQAALDTALAAVSTPTADAFRAAIAAIGAEYAKATAKAAQFTTEASRAAQVRAVATGAAAVGQAPRIVVDDVRDAQRAAASMERRAAASGRVAEAEAERAAAQRAANAQTLADLEAEVAALQAPLAERERLLDQLREEQTLRRAIDGLGEAASAAEVARLTDLTRARDVALDKARGEERMLRAQAAAARDLAGDLADVAGQLLDGADAGDVLRDSLRQIGRELLRTGLQSALGGGQASSGNWVTALVAVAGKAMTASAGGGDAWAGLRVATAHSGWTVGAGSPPALRPIAPEVFAGAPRFHGGGVVGLQAGERPIIARDGEVIGWPDQMRRAFGNRPEMAGRQTVNVFNIETPSPRRFAEDRVALYRGANTLLARAGRHA